MIKRLFTSFVCVLAIVALSACSFFEPIETQIQSALLSNTTKVDNSLSETMESLPSNTIVNSSQASELGITYADIINYYFPTSIDTIYTYSDLEGIRDVLADACDIAFSTWPQAVYQSSQNTAYGYVGIVGFGDTGAYADIALLTRNDDAEISEHALETWDNLKTLLLVLADGIDKQVEQTYPDFHTLLFLLNDEDEDLNNVLIAVYDGDVLFDVLANGEEGDE